MGTSVLIRGMQTCCSNQPPGAQLTRISPLSGQWRYAHITALRGDGVNPALLGMTKVASEDSVWRGLERIEVEDGASWLQGHLDDTVRPLLSEPWVLDCDTTIKPLYGHQEGAVVSYNPKKPGVVPRTPTMRS